MARSATTEERVRELHDRAVRELVAAHASRTDHPLVLAARFRGDDPLDVHLAEVLRDFPGADDDEPLVSEFEPSAQLRILGKLHLVLASPAQLRAAIARRSPLLAELRSVDVLHDDGSDDARELRQLLGR